MLNNPCTKCCIVTEPFKKTRNFFFFLRCFRVRCFLGKFVFLCQLLGELCGKSHELASQAMSSQGTGQLSSVLSRVELNSVTNLDLVSGVASALLFPSVASDQQIDFGGFKCKSSERSSCSLEHTLRLKTKVKAVKACKNTDV